MDNFVFSIERSVKQDCPLAPYLFLIIVTVMNVTIRKQVESNNIIDIYLFLRNMQKVIAQYILDTSLILLSEEMGVRNLIYTLNTFCLALR